VASRKGGLSHNDTRCVGGLELDLYVLVSSDTQSYLGSHGRRGAVGALIERAESESGLVLTASVHLLRFVTGGLSASLAVVAACSSALVLTAWTRILTEHDSPSVSRGGSG
jgi:hypothetical protein